MSQNYVEEMNRRMASGEFGDPVDMHAVNAAWAEIMDKEISGRGKKANYHSVCSLWKDSGKVLLSGRTQEQVAIPEGVKVLVLKREPEEGTRQPDAAIVYVTYDD